MGAVYRGKDPSLDRDVAIKLMNDRSPEFVARFRREARVVARLSHPHIVQVYDFGEDAEGCPYFVMELCPGTSLHDLLETRGKLDTGLVIDLLRQAGLALQAAHDAGIVHRDIKPANLLFGDDQRVRIADFGLARALADFGRTEPNGSPVGTTRYLSPEQARGVALDGRSDVYSLALVLIESVTGSVPFTADTPAVKN